MFSDDNDINIVLIPIDNSSSSFPISGVSAATSQSLRTNRRQRHAHTRELAVYQRVQFRSVVFRAGVGVKCARFTRGITRLEDRWQTIIAGWYSVEIE